MLYLGGFVFLAGYLGTGVAAITTVMLERSARWITLYLAAEFAVVVVYAREDGATGWCVTADDDDIKMLGLTLT